MGPKELIAFLKKQSSQVLPFVGSGMTIAAGAPRTPALAAEITRRSGVSVPPGASLTEVTAASEGAIGRLAVQELLADMVTGWRLRPTPALVALSGIPAGRVFTTNYDDGLERSARSRGIEAISLLPEDVQTMQQPGERELQVIHLHGLPGKPESLVLPGTGMDDLAASEVFQWFVSPRMASSNLLYLGFSFDAAEHHLLGILRWISENVSAPREHHLLLSEAAVRARPDEMQAFSNLGFLTVVPYRPDPTHEMVERVALALAPRAQRRNAEFPRSRQIPTTLQPILVEASPGDDREQLQQKVVSFDLGWAGNEAITTPETMLETSRSLLVAGPGMGKTTLVGWVSELTDRPCAQGSLKAFVPEREDAPLEDAIARLLRVGDQPLPREDLGRVEGMLALDGLDEVGEHLRAQAVTAILAAVSRWPQQNWLITSRPCPELQAFMQADFKVFHILPSRRWARRYLEMRSVPQARVQHAMLDGYGLGDLLSIPQFAARLADRLLEDTDGDVSALKLLVEEQYAASAYEAARALKPQADLGAWMCSLAVALELSGRNRASSPELARVPAPDGLGTEQARGRLVDVTLLADIPGVVAFPLKTLQEGLCADAILKSHEPVAALRHFASAEVDGVERLREDIEMTIDLVFEHADQDTRAALREVDEARWARTVLTVGTEKDAREALAVLDDLHARRGLAYPLFADGALRGSRAAATSIANRWPSVIEERRAQLEEQSRSDDATVRLRAIQTLGGLANDDDTERWLIPRLEDQEPQVVTQAAAIAGRLKLASAEPVLRALLQSEVDRVKRQALAALIEIVDLDGLVEICSQAAMSNRLRPLAERLLERIDLDHAIALVQRSDLVDGVVPWLLAQVIEEAPPEAWNARRVSSLMSACANLHGLGPPDPQMLADIFAHQPQAAVDAVRLQRVGEGPRGPLGQMRPLGLLDPSLWAGKEDLRAAVMRAGEESDEIEGRQLRHEHDMERFLAALDEKGAGAEPEDLQLPMASLHNISDPRGEIVSKLVERWWPTSGLRPSLPEEDLDQRTRAMLSLGSSTCAKIRAERWIELLDAHLAARRLDFELVEDGILGWLARNYSDRCEQVLVQRLAHAVDAQAVSGLCMIAGRQQSTSAVLEGALARLAELGSETPGWSSAVGLLAEAGAGAHLRDLLGETASPEAHANVRDALARYGDRDAQLECLRTLRVAIQAGEQVARPHWQRTTTDPELIVAVAELADSALTAGAEEIANFAFTQLQADACEEALKALGDVVEAHFERRPWLAETVDQLARRIATRVVLDRLPQDLGGLSAEFTRVAGAARSG